MKTKTIKEYFTYPICNDAQETENELNEKAKQGWRVVCSYAYHNNWIILERDKVIEVCDCCGKLKEKQ